MTAPTESHSDPQSEPLYEGKAKQLFATNDPDVLLTQFKDDATAFNAQKRGTIRGKGAINCRLSAALFEHLEAAGIATHYLSMPAPTQMHVRAVTIVPVEVVVRNIAAGSLCRQTGIAPGTILPRPIVEFYYKNDDLGDPLLTRERLQLLDLATPEQVADLEAIALQVNQILSALFASCQMTLVDFKLEFGTDRTGKLLLADEISPDTCRLWDADTRDPDARVLDKDRFRHDLGNVEAAYEQVLTRVLARLETA